MIFANPYIFAYQKLVLVSSEYCRYCKAFTPLVEKLSQDESITLEQLDYYSAIDKAIPDFGVPSLFLVVGDSYYLVSAGYVDYDNLRKMFYAAFREF